MVIQRQSRRGIEILLAAAENRLAVLLGRNPGELHDKLAETKPLPAIPEAIATGIPADVLRQRPDLDQPPHPDQRQRPAQHRRRAPRLDPHPPQRRPPHP